MTKELSDKLIAANLSVLRVSLNGLSGEDYKKYTGSSIDYDQLKENLKYYYENKTEGMKVYIKIMNYMLDSNERHKEFYNTYNSIADVINIEQLTEMSETIDYKDVCGEGSLDYEVGLKGFKATEAQVCPLPFYHIYLNAEGTISGCCVAGPWHTPPALIMGDINVEEIDDIWNGQKFYNLFCNMLIKGRSNANSVCNKCKAYKSYVYPEDLIDRYKDSILDKLTKKTESIIMK